MTRSRRPRLFFLTAALFVGSALFSAFPAVRAQDSASIRSQAVVNLTFDEPAGEALDSATAGAFKDNGTLQNGTLRVKSLFWGQSGKQAVILDAAARQFIQIADSGDVDRPDAVSLSMFFVNLHPAADAGFHGIVAKRDDTKSISNYGINFANNVDTLQLYVNDGNGYKVASYSVGAAIGHRRPVFITAVFQVGDAPAPDADEDQDDVLIRFYANGQPVKPKGQVGGLVAGNDVWLTDVKVANLLTDTPLTLGASNPAAEYSTSVIDEFSLFPKALSNEEVAKLFAEVAGPNAVTQIADEARPVPAAPGISAVSLNGLTRGQTTVLAISGANLLPDPLLVLGAPIEKQVLRPGASAERIEVEVTVPATAAAGHFPLRVQTPHGISGALTIAVDGLPQIPFAESSPEKPVAFPVAISGTLTGQQQVKVYFAGKAGQRLVIDLECKRLGAPMDPVLELRNPRGAPLSIAWGRPQYRGDTRIETYLFADGAYSVELHDLAFKAPGQNSYRLKIGDLKLIDTTFPAAVAAGTQRAVAAIGSGIDSAAILNVDLQNQVGSFIQAVGLPAETGAVGPAPNIVSSEAIELSEDPPADGKLQIIDAQFAQRTHVPIVINGRIARHGEADKYILNVNPGMALNLQVDSDSIHSPLDPQIEVLSHPEGNRLAVSEERPALDIAVPAGASAIQIAIRDLNHRGGSDYVYRLRIVPVVHPDFALAVAAERVAIPHDGSAILRLDATRTGYDGPIALSSPNSAEFTLSPAEIPAGVSKAFVVVSAKVGGPPAGSSVKRLRIVGTSLALDPPLQRVALSPVDNRLALIASARYDLTVALTGQSAATLELGALPPVWFRGVDAEIPVTLKLRNPDWVRQAIRLTLLTTEASRLQPDPSDPAKQRQIPIPMMRSLPEQILSPGDTAAMLRIAVPVEVVEGQIDSAVRADVLPNPYSDKVLASVYSLPFRRLVQNAVAAQLAASNLALTGNAQTKVAGTLKRTAPFTGAIEVSLVNLPAGYTAPKVTVAADQEQFEINVTAPAVATAADLANIVFRVTTPAGNRLQNDTPIPTKVAPPQ